MEIPVEVKEAVTKLSRTNLDFLDFVRETPGCFDRSNFKLLELNDDLFVLQSWPTFVNRENQNQFREVSLKMWHLVKSIPRRVFGYDYEKMSRYYEIPSDDVKKQWEGVDEKHIQGLLGRGDFILSSSGLKCLEYNFSANLGGWQVPIWENLYLTTPLISRFFKEYGVKPTNENLISHFLEHLAHIEPDEPLLSEGKWNIAVVCDGFVVGKVRLQPYFNKLYKDILRKKDASLQGDIYMCDYKDLEIVDNCLFFKGERIHTLVELYMGEVPPGILEVFKQGNIRLMNGPAAWVLANKLNLALLSDHEALGVFNDEEKAFIDRHVPWTRKLVPGSTTFEGRTVDLVDFVLSHREMLVIKPGKNYGGAGVCVGITATAGEWREAVENAVRRKGWAVQQYVESSPGLYQAGDSGYAVHDMSWGFLVFGRRYAGAWVRVLPREGSKGVVNCHQGASVSVIFSVNN